MNTRPESLLVRRRVSVPPLHLRRASLLACTLLATIADADVYTVRREGASIVPVRETTIIMDSEEVVIEPHKYGYNTTAVFVLRNPSDQAVSCTVAFPVAGSTLELGRYQDFTIERRSDTESGPAWIVVPCEIKPGTSSPRQWDSFTRPTPATLAEFTESVVWDATWAPQETLCFRVRFDMGEAKYLSGTNSLVSGRQLTYIVSTGALWAGPIGRADITIRTATAEFRAGSIAGGERRLVSYPENAVWTSETEVTWRFANWTPREEIWVRTVDWHGLAWSGVSSYRYGLPYPYRGTETGYTAAWIDELVEEELTLAREYFPERIAIPLETKKLHILVADWLLHEIYARHGDPFYVGRETAARGVGNGLEGDGEGNLYSDWRSRFAPYGWKGGWYRSGKPVRRSDLAPTERENADFLVEYLNQLRATLPQEALDYHGPFHTPGLGPFPPKLSRHTRR